MDSPSFDIFQIYSRYCEITLEVYASEGDGYRHANESMKVKLAREALSHLLELVESRVYKRMSIFEELFVLMSRLNLMVRCDNFFLSFPLLCVLYIIKAPMHHLPFYLQVDSQEFSRFYSFVFFICRENGQRSISKWNIKRELMMFSIYLPPSVPCTKIILQTSNLNLLFLYILFSAVSRAIIAWKLVLSGRFRLLNQWCSFVENNQRHNISEDTWSQVLAFSRCVHENLEGYDPEGAWPVLIDEFVEHMYRMSGSEDTHKLGCKCGDSEAQPIYEALSGLKVYPGAKRKLDGQELESMDAYVDSDTVIVSKRRHTMEHGKHNNAFGCSKSPCAVEGGLSKGFAQLFSNHSCLQFDHESRVSFT
ncbi:putative defective-in-cullin neddylation protein [Helianthus annuus]|nr:putative defective-in-cullin neddylation protein [Helianthus annuus]